MMNTVRASPQVVRGERKHADEASNPVIHQAMTKKRSVAAIVLDHEQADQKSRGWNSQQQTKCIIETSRPPHQQPKQNEGHQRNRNLDDAAPVIGLTLACK